MSLVRQLYGGQVEGEALQRFIAKEFYEAVQKEGLRTVGYPAFENTNFAAAEKKVSFDAVVEIFPEIVDK